MSSDLDIIPQAPPEMVVPHQLQTIADQAVDKETVLRTAGQRQINIIWETTQALIAITVTGGVIYAALTAIESQTLSNGFFLIVGFYFSRTNHQRVGGIGVVEGQTR